MIIHSKTISAINIFKEQTTNQVYLSVSDENYRNMVSLDDYEIKALLKQLTSISNDSKTLNAHKGFGVKLASPILPKSYRLLDSISKNLKELEPSLYFIPCGLRTLQLSDKVRETCDLVTELYYLLGELDESHSN